MTVAVVTPWKDHFEFWPAYAKALKQGPPPDELFVADNGSIPPLADIIRDQELNPQWIRNRTNLGFTRGCNQGLRAATSDVVVFLNNDIVGEGDGWLEQLVGEVDDDTLVGAQMRYDHHADVDGVPYPYIDGWCLAGTRDSLLTLGGFDEALIEPAYFSDNLLCLEARAVGMTLKEAKVPLRHLGGQSINKPAWYMPATIANQGAYIARVHELVGEPVEV